MSLPASRAAVRTIGIVAFVVVAALLWLCLWITDEVVWQKCTIGFSWLLLIRLCLIGLAATILVAAFLVCVVRPQRSRLAQGCWSAAFASVLALLALEVVFMFVPRSHNVGHTLGSQVWFHYYWGPLNSLGYRDREHVAVPGKRLVFAVGDSFTAGGGLSRVEDRFADVLAARHPHLHVLNLGMNGSDTADELRRLLAHPLQPDVIVLQYYPNDIEGAAMRAGWKMPAFQPYEDLASVKLRFVVRSSFLLDYLYWQFPHADAVAYVRFLERALVDDAVLQHHFEDLEKFCAEATRRGIPLVVVLFPILNDLQESRVLTSGVKQLLASRGVPIVDVAALVEHLEVGERTVNGHDAHASARVHALVADAIGKLLEPH